MPTISLSRVTARWRMDFSRSSFLAESRVSLASIDIIGCDITSATRIDSALRFFYKNSGHQISFGNDSDKVFVAGYKKRPDSIGINFFGGIFNAFILLNT